MHHEAIYGRNSSGTFRSLPIITILIIAVNIIVFLITDLILLDSSAWFEKGAESYYYILHDHEYYRLITAMFLHVDEDHIFNNMLVLGVLGYYLEYHLGHFRFFILYFCSGILAGCTSIVYNMSRMDTSISVGASGATFGLMGALVYIAWYFYRTGRPIDLRRLAFMVILSLYGGFAGQNVDNAAHIGGFISGFLITALLSLTLHQKGRKTT